MQTQESQVYDGTTSQNNEWNTSQNLLTSKSRIAAIKMFQCDAWDLFPLALSRSWWITWIKPYTRTSFNRNICGQTVCDSRVRKFHMALSPNLSESKRFKNKRSSTKQVRRLLVDGSDMAGRRVGQNSLISPRRKRHHFKRYDEMKRN